MARSIASSSSSADGTPSTCSSGRGCSRPSTGRSEGRGRRPMAAATARTASAVRSSRHQGRPRPQRRFFPARRARPPGQQDPPALAHRPDRACLPTPALPRMLSHLKETPPGRSAHGAPVPSGVQCSEPGQDSNAAAPRATLDRSSRYSVFEGGVGDGVVRGAGADVPGHGRPPVRTRTSSPFVTLPRRGSPLRVGVTLNQPSQ